MLANQGFQPLLDVKKPRTSCCFFFFFFFVIIIIFIFCSLEVCLTLLYLSYKGWAEPNISASAPSSCAYTIYLVNGQLKTRVCRSSISFIKSRPPTSSPLTYSCGYVFQLEYLRVQRPQHRERTDLRHGGMVSANRSLLSLTFPTKPALIIWHLN